ncbi:MAG: hypothetical protein ACT4PT_04025 [Methanobacteriota archaeon]
MPGPWVVRRDTGGDGNGFRPSAAQEAARQKLAKIERDCLKLIDCVGEMQKNGAKQTLRGIAEVTGLSKDEVNRYLNPEVRELYTLPRLLHVRGANRRLYNYLIVSGPPKVEEGQWQGILANTSKFAIFAAVAAKYGWLVKHTGHGGEIVSMEYRGIGNVSTERLGKAFSYQEPVIEIDQFSSG